MFVWLREINYYLKSFFVIMRFCHNLPDNKQGYISYLGKVKFILTNIEFAGTYEAWQYPITLQGLYSLSWVSGIPYK